MNYIASKKKVKEFTAKGLYFKKKFGQNFLIDSNIVRKIAEKSCNKDCVCLEIGPGIGSLSEFLCIYAKELIAYEIDSSIIEILKENLKNYDNFKVINEDFLKADLSYLKNQKIVVCANLPYYITTAIIFKLIESDLDYQSINIMMQKEVADRLMAKVNTKDYSALTIILNYLFKIEKLMKVGKEVFMPKPKVDSIVLTLIPKNRKVNEQLFKLIKDAFRMRRKTILNNLKNDYPNIEIILNELGFINKRAQELSEEDFINILKKMRT